MCRFVNKNFVHKDKTVVNDFSSKAKTKDLEINQGDGQEQGCNM